MAEGRQLTLPEKGPIDGRGRAALAATPVMRLLSPSLSLVVLFAGQVSFAAETIPNRPGYLPVQSGEAISDPMTSDAMRSDARLSDVCFVDPQYGWAVGDRGTIWHTENGGGDWHLQRSGVSCPLGSVFFVDRSLGWAVGGFTHPYTHTSSGVVLSTRDGGQTWNRDPGLLLPALKQVRFFNARHGWAVGCSSEMFASGLFVTEDGGRSWNPVPGAQAAGWTAADFLAPYVGALAGRDGHTAVMRQGGAGIEPARAPGFRLRGIHAMTLVAPVYGWLVGDGGLVMMTNDLGMTWQATPGDLPDGFAPQFDFRAVEVRGPRAWIAGSPGTRILHSRDAGQTWEVLPTGQNLPIRAMSFVDDQLGWAVGELGTILATADGGRTWKRQRSGGARAAVMGFFGGPEDIPLELFARLSGQEGYLGVVKLIGRDEVAAPPRSHVHPSSRAHEAVLGVGGSSAGRAWRFPSRDSGLLFDARQILAGWDRANDGRGLDELEAYLVRQIRSWRPEVIVTHDSDPAGKDPAGHIVHQAIVSAVKRAADPTSFAEQITMAGLEPWQVKRVFAVLPPGKNGATNVTTSQLAARLGKSLADVAFSPRGLIQTQFRPVPQTLGFRIVVDNLTRRSARQDFFTGIVLEPGGEARRNLLTPAGESIDALRRVAQKRRNTQAIIECMESEPQAGLGLAAQVGELAAGLDPDSSAQTLYHLAQRYFQMGHWPQAAEMFELLTGRHPQHPLARPAMMWLVQYYSGSETAWRIEGPQRVTVQQVSTPALDFGSLDNRLERAAGLGKHLATSNPLLSAQPDIAFPLATVSRRRGFPRDAERFYMVRARGPARDAWWACARGEEWLTEPTQVSPKPILRCVRAEAKPRLDAKLDDVVWANNRPAELKSPLGEDTTRPAEVMLAYDEEFLYVAVRASQAPGAQYPTSDEPRPYDADLSARDRVDLFIDLDRDYTTYYRLTVDHRGWTGEACWDDATWNPTWFVAAETDGETWIAEAAIGLDQLTGQYPKSRSVWAVGLQRTIPGVGFQTWNTPASVAVIPEGFGYLIFD
jgi:photosystem II stability/assembly factor-like uncharacterized protein